MGQTNAIDTESYTVAKNWFNKLLIFDSFKKKLAWSLAVCPLQCIPDLGTIKANTKNHSYLSQECSDFLNKIFLLFLLVQIPDIVRTLVYQKTFNSNVPIINPK